MKDKDNEIEKLAGDISRIVEGWGFTSVDRVEKINQVNQWLRNFRTEEIPLIFKLLPRIDLQRDVQIEQCLQKICSMIKIEFTANLRNVHFFGIKGHPASSGSQFLYKLKGKLALSDENFPKDYFATSEKSDAYIFIDDFIGSGRQSAQFFNNNLKELTVPCYYYSLYGYQDGVDYIIANTAFKKVVSAEILDSGNKAFSEEFNLEDRTSIRSIAEEYGSKLYPKHPLGFDNSQSVIVFLENCPNNTLPIIWAGSNNEKESNIVWEPLFERKKPTNDQNPKSIFSTNFTAKFTSNRKRKFKSNPKYMVEYFYEKIISNEYNEAFNCLSEKFIKDRYEKEFRGNDYNSLNFPEKQSANEHQFHRFEDGYKNTVKLTPPAILTVINESTHKRFLVHYKEKQKIYKYENLIGLHKKKLKDFEQIQNEIDKFRILLLTEFDVELQKIENIPYQLFFSLNVIEDACWNCGVKHDDIEAKFEWSEQTVITVKYVDCIRIDKEWFIESFSFVNHSGEYWDL